MSKLYEYFQKLEVNPEQQDGEQGVTMTNVPSSQDLYVALQFVSRGGERAGFYKYLLEHRDGITLDLEPLYGSKTEITKELDLVFQFIEYDLKLDDKIQWSNSTPNTSTSVKPSVFQSILSIYSQLDRPGTVTSYFCHEQEEAIKAILGKFKTVCKSTFSLQPTITLNYSTLVVTENADLHSAADELARAWKNHYLPWTIRDVLVQEPVAGKFKDLIRERLATIDPVIIKSPHIKELLARNLKSFEQKNLEVISSNGANIVLGIQRDHVEDSYICAPVVTFNVFRTPKEAAALFNKINGGSASIRSENISEALELTKTLGATNIWINCSGIFDPRGSYQFGGTNIQPGLLDGSVADNIKVKISAEKWEEIWKSIQVPNGSNSKAFISGNFMFNVIDEGLLSKEQVISKAGSYVMAEGISKNPETLRRTIKQTFFQKYKTVAIRFGQTFAN